MARYSKALVKIEAEGLSLTPAWVGNKAFFNKKNQECVIKANAFIPHLSVSI